MGWEGVFLFLPIEALIVVAITIVLFLLLTLSKKSWRTSRNLYIFAALVSLILTIMSYSGYDPLVDWFPTLLLIIAAAFTMFGLLTLFHPKFGEEKQGYLSSKYVRAFKLLIPGLMLIAFAIYILIQ